jgi:hypothetical protein
MFSLILSNPIISSGTVDLVGASISPMSEANQNSQLVGFI